MPGRRVGTVVVLDQRDQFLPKELHEAEPVARRDRGGDQEVLLHERFATFFAAEAVPRRPWWALEPVATESPTVATESPKSAGRRGPAEDLRVHLCNRSGSITRTLRTCVRAGESVCGQCCGQTCDEGQLKTGGELYHGVEGRQSGRGVVIATVLTILLALENVLLPLSGIVQFKAHPIAEATAVAFLNDTYFPAVLTDPDTAMRSWGTANFQRLKEQQGIENYRDYYGKVDAIPRNSVRVVTSATATGGDTYEVSFERALKSGKTDKRRILMRFKCVSWTENYVPTRECSPQNLRLDHTRGLTGAAN